MLAEHAQEADRIRETLQSRVEGIRNRAGLPESIRLQMLARAHQDASSLMSDLQSRVGAETESETIRLRRDAFRPPNGADTLAMRDAHQRAAQLTRPDAAAAALRAAEMQGDEGLAVAIAASAFDRAAGMGVLGRPWADVVDAYTAQRPSASDAISSLAQLSPGRPALDFTFIVPKPTEISRLAPWQLNALANPDDAA